MAYFATLFLILVLVLLMSMVGRRVCDLASFRLAPVYRFYFSPLFGLALFVLVFTIHGWVAPFRPASSIAIVAGLVLAALYLEKNRKVLLRYLAAISLFSLLASSAVLFPLLRFDAYNPFNDTFTYLVHGQWLQAHSFSDPLIASGHHPALTQVSIYQRGGHRMGASFMLGWTQSMFGLKWSYYAFPVAVSLPLIAGSLAAGGAVKLIVRRNRLVSVLTAALLATMFNGFAYGAMSGFFPQTFGLAFAVGGATLLAAVVMEATRTGDLKVTSLNCIPAALVFSALILTYNDMLAFVAAGAAVWLSFLLKGTDRKKAVLIVLLVLFAQTALLVNMELVRVVRNFVNVLLGVGGGAHLIGWPVMWSPLEFLAHAFGFKSPLEGLWILGSREVTLAATVVALLAVLSFVAVSVFRRKRVAAFVGMHSAVILLMVAGFVYFRYFGKGHSPVEAGYTFLQFKLAKWAGPFCLVLMGATLAYLHDRARGRYKALVPSLLVAFIAMGTAGNYRFAEAETAGFLKETGYPQSAFSSFLHLRELVGHTGSEEVIYLNMGSEHEKLRQMVAYALYDRKLATDWTGDNYIGGHLPPDQRRLPYKTAAWVMEFADPRSASSMSYPMAGNLLVRKMPEFLVSLASVTGGHQRESDGVNWWNWTPKSLTYSFRTMGNGARLKFTYAPISDGRELKVTIQAKEKHEFTLKMNAGWNDFVSPPIPLGGAPADVSIRLETESEPVRISPADARMAAFAIRNLELVPSEGAPAR
jgi:hypothetical protein